MRQVRGRSKLSLVPEVGEGRIDARQGLSEWPRKRVGGLRQSRRAGTQETQVDLREEESDAQAEGSDAVAGGVGETLEEAFEPETAEVIAHGTMALRE